MATAPDLAHIPGPQPKPLVGHTLDVLRDAFGFCAQAAATYGPVYKIHNLGQWRVHLTGPDALEFVLNDRHKLFSVAEGWEMIERLFSGGILLRDFEDHRRHRRILQAAFKAPVMENYVARMASELDRQITRWPLDETFKFYPAVKDLTLRLSASVFLGLDTDSPEADRLNRLFSAEVAAITSIVRRPLPFTRMGRGVAARRQLSAALAALIPERRARPGSDFFSQMCVATDETGQSWSEAEIVDHFNFLLAAAHDTTASALSTMVWALGAHREWQERLGAELAAAGPGTLGPKQLMALEDTDLVFKEALRMMPPVPFILRRARQPFVWSGFDIPAGTWIYTSPALVMRDPEHFKMPERFDPDRFGPGRLEGRSHRFAFSPFGGGAHKCIGMHFAGYQAKAFTAALLRRARVKLAHPGAPDWQAVPVPLPRDGLPVRLEPAPALASPLAA